MDGVFNVLNIRPYLLFGVNLYSHSRVCVCTHLKSLLVDS